MPERRAAYPHLPTSTTPPSDSSGTPPVGTDEAPDTPAEVEPSAGEAGATTPANDNAPAEANETVDEEETAEAVPAPELEASNDNQPADPPPATGTE